MGHEDHVANPLAVWPAEHKLKAPVLVQRVDHVDVVVQVDAAVPIVNKKYGYASLSFLMGGFLFQRLQPLEHGSHQCKISSEKMVHLAFHHLIIGANVACLGDVGMLDYLHCQNDSLWRAQPAEFAAWQPRG